MVSAVGVPSEVAHPDIIAGFSQKEGQGVVRTCEDPVSGGGHQPVLEKHYARRGFIARYSVQAQNVAIFSHYLVNLHDRDHFRNVYNLMCLHWISVLDNNLRSWLGEFILTKERIMKPPSFNIIWMQNIIGVRGQKYLEGD